MVYWVCCSVLSKYIHIDTCRHKSILNTPEAHGAGIWPQFRSGKLLCITFEIHSVSSTFRLFRSRQYETLKQCKISADSYSQNCIKLLCIMTFLSKQIQGIQDPSRTPHTIVRRFFPARVLQTLSQLARLLKLIYEKRPDTEVLESPCAPSALEKPGKPISIPLPIIEALSVSTRSRSDQK